MPMAILVVRHVMGKHPVLHPYGDSDYKSHEPISIGPIATTVKMLCSAFNSAPPHETAIIWSMNEISG